MEEKNRQEAKTSLADSCKSPLTGKLTPSAAATTVEAEAEAGAETETDRDS